MCSVALFSAARVHGTGTATAFYARLQLDHATNPGHGRAPAFSNGRASFLVLSWNSVPRSRDSDITEAMGVNHSHQEEITPEAER